MTRRIGSWLLVSAQLAGVALAVWPWPVEARGPLAALAPCVAGAALGVWTLAHNRVGNFSIFPEPKAAARLITTGPYARVRHPMYGALLLMMAGIALWNAHGLNATGFVLVLAAVTGKAAREERLMTERFPEYAQYRQRTRRFVPWVL